MMPFDLTKSRFIGWGRNVGEILPVAASIAFLCFPVGGCRQPDTLDSPPRKGDVAAPVPKPKQNSTPPAPKYPFLDPSLDLDTRARDLVNRLTTEEKIAQMLMDAPAVERLEVPAYGWWNEALHGVARNGRATVFPQAIALGATFDEALVHEVATAISDEARAKYNAAVEIGNRGRYAGLTFWSPNVNIFRDPRWGRGPETFGEDPFLTSALGVAFVKGLQGDHPTLLKTAACAKHFAVHSGPEGLRHEFDAKPSKQDLYETYLPAFEALVKEADVECVMSAYNRLFGEPASGSPWLLKDLLRKEWGFDGYIVSDCWALEDFHMHHKVTRTEAESAALALEAGVNLNCGSTYHQLGKALEEGCITEEQLDDALTTLLKTRFRLGLFDPSTPFDDLSPEIVGSDAHAAIARKAAVESIVLLKNDKQTLPLNPKIKRLTLIGPYAADGHVLLGNYYGVSARMTTLLEGIAAAVDAGTAMEYRTGFLPDRPNLNPKDWSTSAARHSDAVIVTLGLSGLIEGEEGAAIASSHLGDRDDIALPSSQLDYMRRLRKAGNSPIIAVVFAGSPVDLTEVSELADAVLLAWYPGQDGGGAIADILFGRAAPSGRLPITFPKSVAQLPPFEDYEMDRRGYRFSREEPLYPFGFGLSYGKVRYQRLSVSRTTVSSGESLRATVTLYNPGRIPLSEVVQLYLSDLEGSARVPGEKLIAFQRVVLGPGETREIALKIPAKAMALVDVTGKRRIEPGDFRLTAGGASPGPRSAALGSPEPVTARFAVTTN